METQKFEIVNAQSNIDWVGRKVTINVLRTRAKALLLLPRK